jgi:hypothetical protein
MGAYFLKNIKPNDGISGESAKLTGESSTGSLDKS